MKASKMRAKARTSFGYSRRIMWRDAEGRIHEQHKDAGEVPTAVVIVRGRVFTIADAKIRIPA